MLRALLKGNIKPYTPALSCTTSSRLHIRSITTPTTTESPTTIKQQTPTARITEPLPLIMLKYYRPITLMDTHYRASISFGGDPRFLTDLRYAEFPHWHTPSEPENVETDLKNTSELLNKLIAHATSKKVTVDPANIDKFFADLQAAKILPAEQASAFRNTLLQVTSRVASQPNLFRPAPAAASTTTPTSTHKPK